MPKIRRKVLWRDDFGLCVSWPKTEWGNVPEPGGSLNAKVDGKVRRLRVQTEPCNCRGHKPHEHRFLSLPDSAGLKPDQRTEIEVGG